MTKYVKVFCITLSFIRSMIQEKVYVAKKLHSMYQQFHILSWQLNIILFGYKFNLLFIQINDNDWFKRSTTFQTIFGKVWNCYCFYLFIVHVFATACPCWSQLINITIWGKWFITCVANSLLCFQKRRTINLRQTYNYCESKLLFAHIAWLSNIEWYLKMKAITSIIPGKYFLVLQHYKLFVLNQLTHIPPSPGNVRMVWSPDFNSLGFNGLTRTTTLILSPSIPSPSSPVVPPLPALSVSDLIDPFIDFAKELALPGLKMKKKTVSKEVPEVFQTILKISQ